MTRPAIGPCATELEHAAERYLRYLAPAHVYDFDIAALDRLDQSVMIAALKSDDGFHNDGFGYGANALEARVGARGEMSETFHVRCALQRAPACEGLSYREMTTRFESDAVIDPLTLGLPAGSDYHADQPLRWVGVTRWPDGAAAWAPRECIAPGGPSYATRSAHVVADNGGLAQRLFTPITCGLGAGLSLEQALSHGVLELLQRDGNCTRFRAMDRGIDLELDRLEDPGIRRILDTLWAQGLAVRPKLAATDFGLVNLYVIAEPRAGSQAARDDFPLMLTACGEAVHANHERALRKALLEYLAARVRKTFMHGPLDAIRDIAPADYADHIMAEVDPADEEPRALAAMVDWLGKSGTSLRALLDESVFASRETIPFSSLPSMDDCAVSDPADRLADLHSRLAGENLAIYYFDATPAGTDAPRVVKALVPGLEGETLSYHRIGERGARRLIDEQTGLVYVGEPKQTDRRVRLTESAEARLGGAAWFDATRADSIVGDLYALYREPGSHSAQKRLKDI